MQRAIRILLSVLVFIVIALVALTVIRNPERADLDDEARAQAPGEFVTLSQGVTHYDITGPDTGRTVVLVHGFSVPMYIWDSTVVGLAADGYRVIRYDAFGRGYSDRPDVEYDESLIVGQLTELLDSLRVTGPVDLMGLSFGGYTTAAFTVKYPSRVRTLTLVDPVVDSIVLTAPVSWPVIGPWFFQVIGVPTMDEGQLSDFVHPERFPTWVDQYRVQMQYRGFGRALLSTLRNFGTTDMAALYGEVSRTGVPVLLIWGREDQTVPFDKSEVVLRAIPDAQFVPVDFAGHLPHIEEAAVVREVMLGFLAGSP